MKIRPESLMALALLAGCETTPAEERAFGAFCDIEPVLVEDGVEYYQYDGFSPDGRSLIVAWARGEEKGAFILDLESGAREPLPHFNNPASFSPDGAFIVGAFFADDGKTELGVLDRAAGAFRVVQSDPSWDWLPSYSPDGEKLVFNSYRTGASDIYLMDRDGGALERLTDDPRYEAHAQFSPDGSKVLFHRNEEGANYDLYLLDLWTGDLRALTSAPTEESYGSWSPDGASIVFASDRAEPGVNNLYLADADGGNVRRLTAHGKKDAYPFFSPDGGHVYFT